MAPVSGPPPLDAEGVTVELAGRGRELEEEVTLEMAG